ncbi:hypothetical protein A3K73_07725 [Candidatus Pacearchaeota archaeon RBG_13_36_9]|nr:MAG: hypothetical protein A3K73_07725 [Candidatus Pacearchaeota archaeon RBG_13_36_9]
MVKKQKMKDKIIAILSLFMMLGLVSFASAASLSLSLGSYDSEIYTQETVNIPVIVTASNVTGSTDVTLTPKDGLSCSTCTLSYTFTGASSEQGTVTFTLTGTQAGTYNPPFNSISAVSGSTTATPLSSGSSVTVVEAPTWTTSLEASDSNPSAGEEITLTLTITPSGTFEGVSADLTLSGSLTLVSGSDPRTIGTISGQSTYQWTISAASSGTVSVAVIATNPTESAGDNTETVTLTVPGSGTPDLGGGGGGGAATNGTGKTYAVTRAQFQNGFTRQLKLNERVRFQLQNNESHYVTLQAFTRTSATVKVESEPQTATLNAGDEKKFELTGDSYYDLSVKLEMIDYDNNSTNITVKEIFEAVPAQAETPITPTTTPTATPTTPATTPGVSDEGESYAGVIAVLIIVIVVIAIVILLALKFKGKKASKKGEINF